MKTILAPIDFSPVSDSVVDTAAALAETPETRLVLLNVVPPTPAAPGDFAGTDIAMRVLRDSDAIAAANLAAVQRRLHASGITAHVLHVIGPVVDRIVEQAERLEATYVVMGSHGHGAFYDLLVGSTTNGVLKRASCPIVIVPAKNSARTDGIGRGARKAEHRPA